MAKIEVFKVPLTPATKAALDQFTDHQGMPQVTVLSRLCESFAREDPSIQYIVLGLCPPDCTAELATLLLRRVRPRQQHRRNGSRPVVTGTLKLSIHPRLWVRSIQTRAARRQYKPD